MAGLADGAPEPRELSALRWSLYQINTFYTQCEQHRNSL